MKSEDPWDRIHDADRDEHPDPPSFTTGEICFWAIVAIGVIAGISLLAIEIVSAWLNLP